MTAEEPSFVPGEFVVFKFNNEREGMGAVSGAYRYEAGWQYYITNPGNAQVPYIVESSRILRVYRNDAWESVASQDT